MRVDFYQLGALPIEDVVGRLAARVVEQGERLLAVAEHEALLARLDRLLWDGGQASFLPHGIAGGADDARQPVLLSASPDAANLARNLLIADGSWRDAALSFDRAFYLFDADSVTEARKAWKALGNREDVERHYWANEDGRWVEKASDTPRAT